jgi:hypothetical protein
MADLYIGLLGDFCIGQVSNLFLGQVSNFILSLPTGRIWSKRRYLSPSLFSGIIVVDKLTEEVSEMATITLSDILDDLRAADQALRKFEQRYWLSSADFYELYSQGQLDDGQHRADFSEWAGYYKLKLKREAALEQLSRQRLESLRSQATGETLELLPEEPVLELA